MVLFRLPPGDGKSEADMGVFRRAISKSAPIDGEHELFGFLTTAANATVAPIHPKAMPVVLTTPEEVSLWLAADAPKALEFQRPLPDDAL